MLFGRKNKKQKQKTDNQKKPTTWKQKANF